MAAAAYCSATRILDRQTGQMHDFRRKKGVIHSEIIAPIGAPLWVYDREELWNQAEAAENNSTRRATATTGREFRLALPFELDADDRLAAIREFADFIVHSYGVVVDFSIHAPDVHGDKRNFHVHLLTSDRVLTGAGFAKKARELNIANGGRSAIQGIREKWAEIANRHLEAAGVKCRVDCRSNAARGIDDLPSVHLGPMASGMERRGEASERGAVNRRIEHLNALRQKNMEKSATRDDSKMREVLKEDRRERLTSSEMLIKAKAQAEERLRLRREIGLMRDVRER